MKLFTSDGCTYEGMSEAKVIALRLELGRATTFITELEFNAIIEALRG